MDNAKMKIIALAAIPFALALAWAIITNVNLSSTKIDLQKSETTLAQTQTELADTQQQLADSNQQLSASKTELAAAQADLVQTKITLSQTQAQLDSTTVDLNNTKLDLSNTKNQLSTVQNQLTITQTQLTTANSDLSTAKSQLTDTQSQLASAMQQMTDLKKTLTAMGITVHSPTTTWTFNGIQWVHTDNTVAANPTWAGLLSFISADKTNLNKYNINTYNCVNYATTVYNNAESAGLETAMVTIYLKNSAAGHAINGFITSDYGWVWVDCTGDPTGTGPDTISRVQTGKTYRSLPTTSVNPNLLNSSSFWDSLQQYYYVQNDSGGQAVVDTIDIYW